MIAEVPIVDESEAVPEVQEANEVQEAQEEEPISIQEPPAAEADFEVEVVEAPKRAKRTPKPKAEPKPKEPKPKEPKPKAQPRPRKAPSAPPELQPVVLDRFASLSSTELVAELLHRRSHHERENKRLLYRSFLS